jgi:hypothetical protein
VIYCSYISSTKSEKRKAEQVLPGSRGWWWGVMAQIIYTHVSKCKNDKTKQEKKRPKITKI